MALPIRWSLRAARHLESIADNIGADSPHYAALFTKRVMDTVRAIPENPAMGRMVPEYADPGLRERILRGYRIVYRVTSQTIEVVAICHGSRILQNVIEEPDK